MSVLKKKIYLIRHGETAWTISGQHTGTTDIELTENGKMQAKQIGKVIEGHDFARVFCSPLKRAIQTCKLSGVQPDRCIDSDLQEWNYGSYEGLTTVEIWKKHPNWNIFLDGAPQGESILEISARAYRMIDKMTSIPGDIALFSHGHFLRVLAVCWLQLDPREGRHFTLSPGSISILSYERTIPAVLLWNRISK